MIQLQLSLRDSMSSPVWNDRYDIPRIGKERERHTQRTSRCEGENAFFFHLPIFPPINIGKHQQKTVSLVRLGGFVDGIGGSRFSQETFRFPVASLVPSLFAGAFFSPSGKHKRKRQSTQQHSW
jgi:hypothetical protein